MEIIYALDLIGTFAFAVYGASVAIDKEFDIVGVFLCSFLCGVGGGTIRELILGNVPFYFYDNTYIWVMIAGMAFSIVTYKVFAHIHKSMLVIDAIGLATFAYIGAEKASSEGLGLFAIMLFAALSAAGGGILKDILVRDIPLTLKTDLYITPTLIAALIYFLAGPYRTHPAMTAFFIVGIFAVRTYAIFNKVQLWQPQHSSIHKRLWKR